MSIETIPNIQHQYLNIYSPFFFFFALKRTTETMENYHKPAQVMCSPFIMCGKDGSVPVKGQDSVGIFIKPESFHMRRWRVQQDVKINSSAPAQLSP